MRNYRDHSLSKVNRWTEGGSYPVPVPIIDREGNAARDVPVAQVITETHLPVSDLQDGRHTGS